MLTYSEQPKTLDEIRSSIQKHLGEPGGKRPTYSFERLSNGSNRLCFVSYATSDLRYEMRQDLLQIVAKSWRLDLNLEPFSVKTEFAKDKFCLWIESHPDATHRHFSAALRELTHHQAPGILCPDSARLPAAGKRSSGHADR